MEWARAMSSDLALATLIQVLDRNSRWCVLGIFKELQVSSNARHLSWIDSTVLSLSEIDTRTSRGTPGADERQQADPDRAQRAPSDAVEESASSTR